MTRWQVHQLTARDLLQSTWRIVAEYDNYDDAYAHQMYLRDQGESVELRQWMAG